MLWEEKYKVANILLNIFSRYTNILFSKLEGQSVQRIIDSEDNKDEGELAQRIEAPECLKTIFDSSTFIVLVAGQLRTHQADAEVGEARMQVETNLPVLENVNADYVA